MELLNVVEHTRTCLLGLALILGMPETWALPDVSAPIDPTKRASVSTADAVKPSAKPVSGNGVVGGRPIEKKAAPIKMNISNRTTAPIKVAESRGKTVIKPSKKQVTVNRGQRVQKAGDLPASIPRLNTERFQKALADYSRGRVPTDTLADLELRAGHNSVSLAEINRFANPRAALEAQGIPVARAGATSEPAKVSNTVPIPNEKNSGEK